jgi:hypothetical protein
VLPIVDQGTEKHRGRTVAANEQIPKQIRYLIWLYQYHLSRVQNPCWLRILGIILPLYILVTLVIDDGNSYKPTSSEMTKDFEQCPNSFSRSYVA